MARSPFGAPPPKEAPKEGPEQSGNRAITDRLLHSLGQEGERILGEQLVDRALDIDIAAQHAIGFPAHRGGPLFAVGWKD